MFKCINTSVWIPYLVPEILQPQARNLTVSLLTSNVRLVAPAFAWVEVGSVLRKKVRLEAVTASQAAESYDDFCQMPVDYLNSNAICAKTWASALEERRSYKVSCYHGEQRALVKQCCKRFRREKFPWQS